MYWTDLKIDLGDYKNPNKHSLVIDQKATSVVCKDKLSAEYVCLDDFAVNFVVKVCFCFRSLYLSLYVKGFLGFEPE